MLTVDVISADALTGQRAHDGQLTGGRALRAATLRAGYDCNHGTPSKRLRRNHEGKAGSRSSSCLVRGNESR